MAGRKVVQTELEMKEYEALRRVVERRGLTIKQGLREAIQQWIATQIPLEEDPLFKVKPVKTGVKTDSSNLDRALYRKGSK
ncbi:hypothetical protein J7L29_03305 [Candidatus Bathyarchaeota archaeon]|nr:hypothetical protein [Candidatus Bathyarchaeota archaeon]